MSIKKVLIVDDSKTEQIYLSEMLNSEGYLTLTASNAEEAQKLIDSNRPDLILLDIVMPGQSGFQFARTLTRDAKYADIPIFLCTNKDQETDRIWGIKQGAKAYIVKHVQKPELIEKINALFNA